MFCRQDQPVDVRVLLSTLPVLTASQIVWCLNDACEALGSDALICGFAWYVHIILRSWAGFFPSLLRSASLTAPICRPTRPSERMLYRHSHIRLHLHVEVWPYDSTQRRADTVGCVLAGARGSQGGVW
jgi:hypothetical protein